MLRKFAAGCALATLAMSPVAGAAVYSFETSQTVYEAAPGSQIQVPVFFREEFDPATEDSVYDGTSSLAGGNRALYVAIFDIQPTPTAGAENPGNTDVNTDSVDIGGGEFFFFGFDSDTTNFANGGFVPDPTDGGGEVRNLALGQGQRPASSGAGFSETYLGFFLIDVADNNAFFSLPFSTADFQFANEDSAALDPLVLEFSDFQDGTGFTVVVPEPATALAGLGAAGLMLMRRRR